MTEITATKDRSGSTLQIISPGVNLGMSSLAGQAMFTSRKTDAEAVYIFCKSLLHVSEGTSVTDSDAPIDARGGVYLNANRGKQISVRLLAGEDAATVWIHEVR